MRHLSFDDLTALFAPLASASCKCDERSVEGDADSLSRLWKEPTSPRFFHGLLDNWLTLGEAPDIFSPSRMAPAGTAGMGFRYSK